MASQLDLEIRAKLADYLVDQIPLTEFQEWFVPATWDAERLGNQVIWDLVGEIQLRLAEFSNGHWTEQELRKIFQPLTSTYAVSISYATQAQTVPTYACFSDAETLRPALADTRFAVASE